MGRKLEGMNVELGPNVFKVIKLWNAFTVVKAPCKHILIEFISSYPYTE